MREMERWYQIKVLKKEGIRERYLRERVRERGYQRKVLERERVSERGT